MQIRARLFGDALKLEDGTEKVIPPDASEKEEENINLDASIHKDPKTLHEPNDLQNSKGLSELKDLQESKDLQDFQESKDLQDFQEYKDPEEPKDLHKFKHKEIGSEFTEDEVLYLCPFVYDGCRAITNIQVAL